MEQASTPKTGRGGVIAVVGAVLAALLFWWLGPNAGEIALVVKVNPAGATVRVVEPRLEKPEIVATHGEARFGGLAHSTRVRATVSAKGYVQEVIDVTLPAKGAEHRVTVGLKRESGLYTVRSEPDGALLYVDGKAVGVAPVVLTDLVPGPHELTAHLQGYEKGSLKFVAEAGAHRELRVVLTPLPGYDAGPPAEGGDEEEVPEGFARLIVTSTHDARFFAGNYVLGYGRQLNRTVRAGVHRIAARAEGRGTKWQMVTLEEGDTVRVDFAFDEDPLEKAFDATDPSKPIYWIIRGGSIRGEGRYGDAIDHFKRALELDPNDAEAHRQLSRTYPALKKWDEAIEHSERYLELDPAAPDAEFTRELLLKLKELKAAER